MKHNVRAWALLVLCAFVAVTAVSCASSHAVAGKDTGQKLYDVKFKRGFQMNDFIYDGGGWTTAMMEFAVREYDAFGRPKPGLVGMTKEWCFVQPLSESGVVPSQVNTKALWKEQDLTDFVAETGVCIHCEVPSIHVESLDEERGREIRQIVGGGIVFGYKDPLNYYLFRTAGMRGVVLGKMVDGTWTDIANPTAIGGLDLDHLYILRVRVENGRIRGYLNGNVVVDENDDTFKIGKVGLSSFRCGSAFTYLNIWEPASPRSS